MEASTSVDEMEVALKYKKEREVRIPSYYMVVWGLLVLTSTVHANPTPLASPSPNLKGETSKQEESAARALALSDPHPQPSNNNRYGQSEALRDMLLSGAPLPQPASEATHGAEHNESDQHRGGFHTSGGGCH